MMADTILLILLILGLIAFLIYALIRGSKLSGKKFLTSLALILTAIISLFFYSGFNKIQSDFSRIIHNSRPKSPAEIYTLLFKKAPDSCIYIVNLKDQVIPKMDCCIWMEVELCPSELNRIARLKKYATSEYSKSDSLIFLQTFGDRPAWWLPQHLGDSITRITVIFNEMNQQSIFFGADSSHVFICDQAL